MQKLLQTYFGTMRHCLVCSLTVGATNFAASSTSSHGVPLELIPKSTEDAEDWRQSSEKRKTEEAYYLIIFYQGIDDSRVDQASYFLNFPEARPWNLVIWEWCFTLPRFVLANRQTTVYFRIIFKLYCGLATELHVSNNYRSYDCTT